MSKFIIWLTLAVSLSGLTFFIYVSGQQILRQGANDPQITIAEDLTDQLTNGAKINDLVAPISVDIAKSLSPFIIVYDMNGTVLKSQAVLDGIPPKLPSGVLDQTKRLTENRITWQPKSGVRTAIVVSYYVGPNNTSGFVLVGRSLREVERRIDQLSFYAICTWIAVCILMGLGFALTAAKHTKR